MTCFTHTNHAGAPARRTRTGRIATGMMPALIALLAFAAVFGSAGAAQARQCVWNKAWFVLNVKWYDRDDLVITHGLDGAKDIQVLNNARPLQEDQFPAAQGRCFTHPTGEQAVAVLRVWGGDFAVGLSKVAVGALVAAGTAAVGVAACPVTAGTSCVASVAGGGAIVGGVVSAIPGRSEVFDFVVPRTDRWTDVWGTAYEPVANVSAGGRF